MCRPGCIQGKKLKVPVYVFLKEAIIRKYGEEFYGVLEQVAESYTDGAINTQKQTK